MKDPCKGSIQHPTSIKTTLIDTQYIHYKYYNLKLFYTFKIVLKTNFTKRKFLQ